jgi:hypothetical protein
MITGRAATLGLLLSSFVLGAPTFSKDVAPIFYRRCVQCHHPNDIAPMSLLDYKSARPWAKAIRESVLTRKMPPWFADPHYGSFSNDAHLSGDEIRTIESWVDSGAAEGNPRDLPRPPVFTDGWKLGKPDIVIDIGEDYVTKPGADSYEHFVVPTNLTEGVWARALEIRPGNRKVVHHAHVNLVRDKAQEGPTSIEAMTSLSSFLLKDGKLTRIRQDAPVADDGCAADAPNLPYLHGAQEGALASYLPGREPDIFPDGTAKWIPPNSKLQFVIHYAPTRGPSQEDRTSLGIYLAPRPPERELRRMDLRNFFFRIPAGAPSHKVTRCYTFERDKLLLSITPHMHYRGHDARYEVVRPDGTRETLLYVPHYNFNWQYVYRFRDPIRVEKGSTMIVTMHYDNSVNNPVNPDPTKTLRWGDKTEEEMMTSWIEYIDPEIKSSRALAPRR